MKTHETAIKITLPIPSCCFVNRSPGKPTTHFC